MTIEFVVDPPITDDLRARIVDLWVEVTNAGGAVGFVPLAAHWRTLKRVMVRPGRQGRGYGRALMREAEALARKLGLAALKVTVRGGAGTEDFYATLGYVEVGRVPGALRVAPGDDRDEFHMWLQLEPPDRKAD
jgi:GNAT superfamily N-acetyltransferase